MNQRIDDCINRPALRRALGQFPTGVAIVTALTEDCQPVGMTINSFNSVSLTPSLISWSIDHRSASYRNYSRAKSFTVTILAEDQKDLAIRFATKGANKFWGIESNCEGPPVIPNGCAWFKCKTYRSISLGDHRMIVGKVVEFDINPFQPLVFKSGQFQQLANSAELETQAAA